MIIGYGDEKVRSKKYYKIASYIGLIGLILLMIVILSNSAYPSMLFKVLAPLGMLLIFISVILLGISWVFRVRESLKRKDYIASVIIIIIGLIFIFNTLR